MTKWRRWTAEEMNQLHELKDQKLNLTEIALQLDRTYSAVKARSNYLDSPMVKKPSTKRPKIEPVKHYAKMTEISDKNIRLPCIRCGKTFLSWDKRKNRMCNNCRTSNTDTMFDHSVSGMKKAL